MDEGLDELPYLLGILEVAGPGRSALRRALAPLLAGGASLPAALETVTGFAFLEPISTRVLETVARPQPSMEAERRAVAELGLSLVRLGSPAYPAPLAAIPDPPLALFVGGAGLARRRAIAVVGSRRCRPGTARLAFEFAARLAEQGFVVVSGLAEGIDGAAHRGALDAGGVTLAVLGNGLSHCYPAWHRRLAEEIADEGALISEYPPSRGPRPHHFPERNRIISGLCEAVLVVEASARSGSLITARLALEQGRDVMAVPGPVGGGAHRGCHRLLKDGASLVEEPEDLWDVLGIAPTRRASQPGAPPLDAPASGLLAVIEAGAQSTDAIIEAFGESAARTLSLLTELELKGFVEAVDDGYIRRPFK